MLADLITAADGIHSELRPYAAPPSRPIFHGSVAFRGVLPHRRIRMRRSERGFTTTTSCRKRKPRRLPWVEWALWHHRC
jgi:hypothetical protein